MIETSIKTQIKFLFCLFNMLVFGQITPGSIDQSFTIGTGFDDAVGRILLQPDGKILAGGYFTAFNGQPRRCFARLNSDGTLDASFNIGTGFTTIPTPPVSYFPYATHLALQTDGKIIIGGHFTYFNGQPQKSILRLNSDGSVDDSFNIDVSFTASHLYGVTLQPDGKILVSGLFMVPNNPAVIKIVRLNSNGSLDTTFNTGFSDIPNSIGKITLQPDGKILLGGTFTIYNGQAYNRMIRLNSNGTVDSSFNMGSGFNGSVNVITMQSDGKILVGGGFSEYNGQSKKSILRLNSDGSLDNTFSVNPFFISQGSIGTIALQSDGKILMGGTINTNVYGHEKLARLFPNGSIDYYYNSGSGFSSSLAESVGSVSIQPDGKILVGGSFQHYNGEIKNRIIRLLGGEYLGTDDLSKTSKIKSYPNPFIDQITISSDNENLKEIIIVDVSGKQVKNEQIKQTRKHNINTGKLPSGIYTVLVKTSNGTENFKMLKK